MSECFREADQGRLVRRLRKVTGGDLATPELERLADGDLSLVSDLPPTAQIGVLALTQDSAPGRGTLEKLIGVAIDYVPVAYLDLARSAADAVARVVARTDRSPIGSGAMVSPRLFLTNNHVTADPAAALAQLVQLDHELTVDGRPKAGSEFRLDPDAFFWTSPEGELDATLVAVGEQVSGDKALVEFGALALSATEEKHAVGDFVTVIQHPEGDFKQIALRENRIVGRGARGLTLHYQADTLGGSSGSPVFNDQFQLVALHHAGGPHNDTELDTGEAVPEDSNEGIRVSAIVKALRERLDTLPAELRGVLAEALDPPATGPRLEASAAGSASPAAPVADAVSVAGQLPITITVGPAPVPCGPAAAPVPPVPPAPPVPPVAESRDALERNAPPDPAYSRRRGYDPKFLAVEVALPELGDEVRGRAAVPEGGRRDTTDGLRLDYLHFSTVQHADRRLPIFTAVNVDGRRLRRIDRTTGVVEATERWFPDPRIAPTEQLDQSTFERQRPRIFDRGHMVRRLDPAWGSAATAAKAAADTFHFANCCPQVSAFNQGKRIWAGIEDFVLDNARADRQRISVLTGPVLAPDDPPYRGVPVPRAFWKILVRVHDGALRATGFVADQGELLDAALAADGTESFDDLGVVEVFQRTIGDIADLTGLRLGALVAHDTQRLERVGAAIGELAEVDW